MRLGEVRMERFRKGLRSKTEAPRGFPRATAICVRARAPSCLPRFTKSLPVPLPPDFYVLSSHFAAPLNASSPCFRRALLTFVLSLLSNPQPPHANPPNQPTTPPLASLSTLVTYFPSGRPRGRSGKVATPLGDTSLPPCPCLWEL